MTKPFRTIAGNAFTVTLADPFFLVLHLSFLTLAGLIATMPGFTQDDEHIRLLRDQSLALFFMIGCLTVIFGMIRSVTDDFRRGAGGVLMSRPIGPYGLLLGKWAGVMGAIVLMSVSAAIGCVWLAEIAGNGSVLSQPSLITYIVTLVVGIIIAGVRHYLLRGSFPTWANVIIVVTMLAGFLLRLAISPHRDHFDWPALQGVALLVLGLAAFAAIILPVSLLVDSALVLAIGIALFFGGLVSNYFIKSAVSIEALARLLTAITPNWQIYWVADRLSEGASVPGGYFVTCGIHALAFITLSTAIGALILSRMEVHNNG